MTGGRMALVRLIAAYAVSMTGTRVSAVAIPWFVLVTTGSATRTGLVLFVEMAPYVVVKALAGPMIDRRGPRPVSVWTDLVSTGLVAAVPALYLLGALPYWLLLVLVAAIGTARGPGDAAKAALVPRVAETAGVRLERATGLVQTVQRLATAVGPALAAALLAVVEPTTALLVDAASFALAGLLLAPALRRRHPAPIPASAAPVDPAAAEDEAADESEPYLRRLRAGASFMHRDRLLRAIVLMVGITNLIDAAFIGVLLPVWARESGRGVTGFGILLTVISGAAVAGSLLAAGFAHRLPYRLTYFVCFSLGGPPLYFVLAGGPPLPAIIAVYTVCGLLTGLVNPILSTVMLRRIPANLTGRVLAMVQAVAWVGIPLGGLVGGALTESIGITAALLACGGYYLVVIAVIGAERGWREMDRAPAPAAPARVTTAS
ncbi:MAG TPA: MFS transporter [Natronosporangium sp.]